MADEELICPSCAGLHPSGERFCEDCGMPLIHRGPHQATPTAVQLRARKIKPQYAQGNPVKVAHAANLSEAEFIAGLLLEEGIPSYLSSSIAGHGPLAGGRDVLVPQSGAEAAREALSFEQRTGPPET